MTHKIVYITGTRADFGRAKYLLRELEKNSDFELFIIATCMHLSPDFGNTINEIEEEFKVAAKPEMLLPGDTNSSMVQSFGLGVTNIAKEVEKINPDSIIVLGDRGEMLAGAIIGAHLNIPVIHIGGGHLSGSIDDKIRDAITVFSNLHFVANDNHAKRVEKLGVDNSNIYVVGAPDLEAIRKKDYVDREEVAKEFGIDSSKPLILALYHPVTDESSLAEKQMTDLCEAIKELGMQTVFIHPNSDSGGRRMAKVLESYSKDPLFKTYKNIPYEKFLGMMDLASLMVGNSSAGIIESSSFHLPVVNIGVRQSNRERSDNIIDVNTDKANILEAMNKALNDKSFLEKAKSAMNPFGDGHTSTKIIKVLKEVLI